MVSSFLTNLLLLFLSSYFLTGGAISNDSISSTLRSWLDYNIFHSLSSSNEMLSLFFSIYSVTFYGVNFASWFIKWYIWAFSRGRPLRIDIYIAWLNPISLCGDSSSEEKLASVALTESISLLLSFSKSLCFSSSQSSLE